MKTIVERPSVYARSKRFLRALLVSTIGVALVISMAPSSSADQAPTIHENKISQEDRSGGLERLSVMRRPDIGDKPSFLNGAEWDAYTKKVTGKPYNKSIYKAAVKKFEKNGKEVGRKNAQKRANDKRENNHPNKHAYVVKARWDGRVVVTFVVVVVGTLVVGAIFSGGGFLYSIMQNKATA